MWSRTPLASITGLLGTTDLVVGEWVRGAGIPAGATIKTIAANSITISVNATASSTAWLSFALPLTITPTAATTTSTGNKMDQTENATAGQTPADEFAIPTPLNGRAPFTLPYSQDTLPLIIPGPHVVSSSVPQNVYTQSIPTNITPGVVTSTITISQPLTVSHLGVQLNISYPKDSDLRRC